MKYIIDEIQPWNIPILIEDIQRLVAPMTDYAVGVWHCGEMTLHHGPVDISKVLADGATSVIIKRHRPEPGEPSPE